MARRPGRRLVRAARPLSVVNEGISGNRVRLDALPSSPEIFGPSGLSRLDGDVLATAGVTDAILLEGINDLGQTPPATAAQVIAGLQQVVTRLQVAGVRVHLGTLTPSGGYGAPTYGSPAATPSAARSTAGSAAAGCPTRWSTSTPRSATRPSPVASARPTTAATTCTPTPAATAPWAAPCA